MTIWTNTLYYQTEDGAAGSTPLGEGRLTDPDRPIILTVVLIDRDTYIVAVYSDQISQGIRAARKILRESRP